MPQARAGLPAFRLLEQDLRARISQGDYPEEVPLPTESELARQYSVSRQTVRRAFQDLVGDGLVSRVPGRGTFTTPPSQRYLRQLGTVEDLMALSVDSTMHVLAPLSSVIDPTAAGRLTLDDDRVAALSFLRFHGGAPFSHTRVFLPPFVRDRLGDPVELCTAGAVSRATVIGLLDRAGTAVLETQQSITVATAPDDVATALDVSAGSAVLRIDRTYYDGDSTPIELAISHFHPDRYSYRVRLRRRPQGAWSPRESRQGTES